MSKPNLSIYITDGTDPWFNLAVEDWLFQDLEPNGCALFLWRNDQTVVIGRSQNPWAECHIGQMEQDKIKLARRQTGGGAVYHDLGNTNFTFLSNKKYYNKQANHKIILNTLKAFNITAYPSGRNDILVEHHGLEKKISGSAFRETKDRAFHHGTLLLNTDLTQLPRYLNPNKKKLTAKGVKSVQSRVINLAEINNQINHQNLSDRLISNFENYYNNKSIITHLDSTNLNNYPEIQKKYNLLQSWDWRFGKTLEFTHDFQERLSWGSMDVKLKINNGMIEQTKIYSDSLYPDLIENIAKLLTTIPYSPDTIKSQLDTLAQSNPENKKNIVEFSNWIGECVD